MISLDLDAQVKQLLNQRLGIPPEDILTDARLVDDLGMDSLDAVELAIAMERAFDISVSEDSLGELQTVADVIALVQELKEGQTKRVPVS